MYIFFVSEVWLGVCDTRDRWPPACNSSGCRHAPISVIVGFTGNRPSHMRKVRRADVDDAIEPDGPSSEKRTFECQACQNEAIEVVKYR